jgi:hypothetical protein
MNDLVTRYLDSWNETNASARRRAIDDLYAADASYVDPMVEAYGRNAIDATVGAVQAQFPGFAFSLIGPVDAHHRQVRFTWGLGPVDAEPIIVGFDVAVVDEDGQLSSVHGFLDRVPA